MMNSHGGGLKKSMTVCSLILVNYPQMAELFRWVKYDNLPTCMFGMRIQTVYFVFRGNDIFFSEHARLIPGAYHHKILLCWHKWQVWANVGKTTINHQYLASYYHYLWWWLGMVYCCFTHITYISFGPTHDLKGSPNVSLRSSRVATICHDAFKGWC